MIHRPTFPEVLQVSRSHGKLSENPQAWDGLVACYAGTQGMGPTWFDLSGYGNDGTLTNGPSWSTEDAPAQLGGSLAFDGNDDRVLIGTDVSRSYLGTCMGWIKPSLAANHRNLISAKVGAVTTNNMFSLLVYQAGGQAYSQRVGVYVRDGSDDESSGYGSTVVSDNEWHLIGARNIGNGLEAIIDGKVESLTFFANEIASTQQWAGAMDANAVWNIGTHNYNNSYTQNRYSMLGPIAWVGLWDRGLTDAEIKDQYNRPAAMFTPRQRVWPAAVAPLPSGARGNVVIGGGICA